MNIMTKGRRQIICKLFGVDLPIVQAGMVWVSGAKLASAASNAGVLGIIGAASMSPDLLRKHIIKAKALTKKTFGVNIPLLYKKTDEQIDTALDEGVKVFITSAGSPRTYTRKLKDQGCIVAHVVSSPLLAKKCEDAGVDVVIAEGFEAGGHNGRDETTTIALVPQVIKAVKIPVIAAGGIGSGASILSAFALGAHGVQIGTRFVATKESSAHDNFRQAIIAASSNSTALCMKNLVPVRLLKNSFYKEVNKLENNGATKEQLANLLGKGRAKLGMFEGDLEKGELEIGQGCGDISDVPSVSELISRLSFEYRESLKSLTE